MLTEENKLMMRALAEVVKRRYAQPPVENRYEVQPPSIRIPSPEVHNHNRIEVNPTPVTNEVTVSTDSLALSITELGKLVSQLALAVIASQEATVKAIEKLAAREVVVKAPDVHVNPTEIRVDPTPVTIAPRPARKIVITHEDGTQSTVQEV